MIWVTWQLLVIATGLIAMLLGFEKVWTGQRW